MRGSGASGAAGTKAFRSELVLRLTLIYLLLKPIGEWWIQVPVLALAAFGLLFPGMLRRSWVWWALTLASTLRVVHGFAWMDNHAYLLTYWLFAIALYLTAGEKDRELATHARFLVGASFAFAVVWKTVLTSDFLSGDFFHMTLLLDERFRDLGLIADLVSPAQWKANMAAFGELRGGERETVELASSPRLSGFVRIATWWTILLEAGVALAFLLPSRWAITRAKDALLLLFAWSTYPFATVAGFGWLLMILGIAQCPRRNRILLGLYLVSFVAILIMRDAPWTSAIFAFR